MRNHYWLAGRYDTARKLGEDRRRLWYRHADFFRVVVIVQSDAHDLAGSRDRSKPVRVAARHEKAVSARVGQCVGVGAEAERGVARGLEPATVHVEPRQGVGRTLARREQFFA